MTVNADEAAHSIAEEMEGIVKHTEQMEELTRLQAGRSKQLNEITDKSMEGARQTVEGAGRVVGVTEELQKLSRALTEEVEQFKVRSSDDVKMKAKAEAEADDVETKQAA